MQEFNRNSQSKAREVAFLTSLFCCLNFMIVAIIARNWIVALMGSMIMLQYFIVVLPITKHFPKDFNYNVEVQENFLIFSWGDGDKRAMCRLFTSYAADEKNITIYDCNSVITVPYCEELIEFLEGIDNEHP